MNKVNLPQAWLDILGAEFSRDYFKKLAVFVREEYLKKKIFPQPKEIFRAFELCLPAEIKVVILGQDPYHGVGQANGLCFAVRENVSLPPSLKNIFKEIESDLGIKPLANGDLSRWAKQGVLLLNSTLTVEAREPGSHQGRGWEEFTDVVIRKVAELRPGLVFILWGNYAKKKGSFIDRTKHLVLEAQHPSPFSAHQGFFGCRHFSQTNKYLRSHGQTEIDWR